MKNLILIGILIIFIGIITVFIGALTQMKSSDTKVAVGGIIGFIPFGFANDKRLLYFVISLTAILFIFWILYFWK